MKIKAIIGKTIARFKGGEYLNNYLRRQGMEIGEGTHIFSDISTTESYLIRIGDRTTISNNVQFVTHDASIQKVIPEASDLFGKITIGNNCFIGARAIILYGVSLPDNTIVAAGSVVTKSVCEEGCILAGNPARVVSTCERFAQKNVSFAVNIHGLTEDEKRKLLDNDERLVKR